MPNHVTTICTVRGRATDIARFQQNHIRIADGETRLDFQSVIPMPDVLDGTVAGTSAELAIFAISGEIPPHYSGRKQTVAAFINGYGMLRGSDVTNQASLHAWIKTNYPAWLAEGHRAVAAFEETGYYNWYDWCRDEWGTKWNSYDYKHRDAVDSTPDVFVFQFDTAWSFPEPIFDKLALLYPMLVFAITSFDEGWGFACIGEFNGQDNYETVDATDELYEIVYGHKPEREPDPEAN